MTVNHPITVDLVQPGLTPRLYAMQHDANSRVIVFTLTQAGQPWEAPAGAIFGLSYRKSDGTRGYYTENITCTASQISVSVAPQVLTCSGMVDAALVCNAANGSRIAAFPLQIQVRPDPAAGKTDSDDYFNPSDALRYTPQDLTDAQKTQARANIGAAAPGEGDSSGGSIGALTGWEIVQSSDTVTLNYTLEDGSDHTDVITFDANGYPVSITHNGVTAEGTWTEG